MGVVLCCLFFVSSVGVSLFCLVLSCVGVFVRLIVVLVCVCGCNVFIVCVGGFCCGRYLVCFVCFSVFANVSFLVCCLMRLFF